MLARKQRSSDNPVSMFPPRRLPPAEEDEHSSAPRPTKASTCRILFISVSALRFCWVRPGKFAHPNVQLTSSASKSPCLDAVTPHKALHLSSVRATSSARIQLTKSPVKSFLPQTEQVLTSEV